MWLQTPRYSGCLMSSLVHARVWNLLINVNLYFRILAWHGFTAPSTKVTFTQFFNFFSTIFNICPWFRSKNSIVEIDMIYEITLVSPCRFPLSNQFVNLFAKYLLHIYVIWCDLNTLHGYSKPILVKAGYWGFSVDKFRITSLNPGEELKGLGILSWLKIKKWVLSVQ